MVIDREMAEVYPLHVKELAQFFPETECGTVDSRAALNLPHA
jgi:hypothetical protein